MLFETLGQARIFLAMAWIGAAACAAYDLMQVACRTWEPRARWIPEAVYALICAALLFIGMTRTEATGLRPYLVLGSAVGWFLYAVSVSHLFHTLVAFLRRFVRKKAKVSG